MKQKIKLLGLCSFLIASLQTKAQLKTWSIGNKNVDVATTSPTVSSNGLPSSFYAQNCAYDQAGKPLFYVGRWKIYNRYGEVIDDIDCMPSFFPCHWVDVSAEFPIVPCVEESNEVELDVCIRRYYVFYTNADDNQSYLYAKLVTITGDGSITSEDVLDAAGSRRIIAESELRNPALPVDYRFTGLAVSKVNSTNTRFLYWVAGRVIKIPLTVFNNTNSGINTDETIFTGAGFNFSTCEADLSPDGTKLLWGGYLNAVNTTQSYFLLDINTTTGNWNGSVANKFDLNKGLTSYYTILGVEFSPNGDEFYVTTAGLTSGHGIYRKSLNSSSSPFVYIPNTEKYGSSQLELAPNGLVYAGSSMDFAGFDYNTYSFPLGVINVPGNLYAYSTSSVLPDQIDGENYNAYSFPSFYDIKNYTATVPGSWTMASNPIATGGNTIRIMGELIFNTQGEFKLNNMNFEFGPNGKITVGYGVILTITNSTFKSTTCGEMWKGMEVYYNGTLNIMGNDSYVSTISDASIGVDVKMTNAKIRLVNVDFKRNIVDVKIVDFTPYSSHGGDITGCRFYHTEPIRLGSTSGLVAESYGITGIDISTKTAPNVIPLSISKCLFEGSMINGILVKEAPIVLNGGTVGRNKFKDIKGPISKAINIDMKKAKYKVDVFGTDFSNVTQAIYAKGKTNLTMKSCTVETVEKHAIEWVYNGDCQLEITDNTFLGFQLSGVMAAYNTGTIDKNNPALNRTKINIYGNTFDNTNALAIGQIATVNLHKPTAVSIEEKGVAITRNFTELRVNNNTITKVAYGVRISNIAGHQQVNKEYNDKYITTPPRADISDVDHNTIEVYATYNTPIPDSSDYNTGILLGNSRGLRGAVNNISSNQYTQWRSMGIRSEHTQNTLFFGNTLAAGRGIAAAYTSTGNDIKCNIITKGVNGISLQDYKMRNKGDVHGIPLKDARENYFFATKAQNMELYLYRMASIATNLRVVIDANQWLLSSTTTTMLIEPDPASLFSGTPLPTHLSYIKKSGAPDNCGFPIDDGRDDKNFLINPIGQYPDDSLHQWQMQYDFERERKQEGEVFIPILSKLIDVEQYTAMGDDSGAYNALQEMPPTTNEYEKNYIILYNLILTARLDSAQGEDSAYVEIFKSIAARHVYDAGPAVYLARAVLWAEQGMNFIDIVDRLPGIGFRINYSPCFTGLPQDLTIRLLDNANKLYTTNEVPVVIDSTGDAYIAPSVVATLPTDKLYTFVINNGAYPSPDFQSLAAWMDNDNNAIALCSYGKNGNLNAIEQEDVKLIVAKAMITEDIKVYPNPAVGNIFVSLPSNQIYTVELYDVTGKKVYSAGYEGSALVVVNQYPEGLYFVRIADFNGNFVHSNRILIRK